MGLFDKETVKGYVKYKLDGITYTEYCGPKPANITERINKIKASAKSHKATFQLIDSGQTTKKK